MTDRNAPTLFGPPQLTVTDIDSWLTDIRKGTANATYCIYPGPRASLSAILGTEIPHRVWTPAELTGVVARARKILTADTTRSRP